MPMRAYLPDYDLYAPPTLGEALALMAAEPGQWRPLAGGTDLMVQFGAGSLPRGKYLALWKIAELRGIDHGERTATLGALTTYTDVLQHATLTRDFPLLGRAAAETGSVATQNRGTIGGNIVNASPAADTPPALLVYDADVLLRSARGSRWLAYDRFHRGYKQMDLAPDELLMQVRLHAPPQPWKVYYRKVGARRAQAIAKVCLAAGAAVEAPTRVVRDLRLALNGVAPTVVRCRHAEHLLRGRTIDAPAIEAAVHAVAADIAPITDARSTARYRARVAGALVREFLESL